MSKRAFPIAKDIVAAYEKTGLRPENRVTIRVRGADKCGCAVFALWAASPEGEEFYKTHDMCHGDATQAMEWADEMYSDEFCSGMITGFDYPDYMETPDYIKNEARVDYHLGFEAAKKAHQLLGLPEKVS